MTKFNKKQATFKRPKNFLFAVISCFLLALASPFIIDKIFVSASETDPTTSLVYPQAAQNLTYDSAEHALVNDSAATQAVEWQYAVTESYSSDDQAPSENWSTEIPKRTEAGTYYVWYKVETPVCKTPLVITIEKATPKMPEDYSSPGVSATAECEKASDIPLNNIIQHPLDVNGKPLDGQWIWPDNYNENNYSMDQLYPSCVGGKLYPEFVPDNSNYNHIDNFPVIFKGYTASDPKSPSTFSKALIYNGQPQALVDTANATNTVDWQYFYYQKNGDETPTLPYDASWSSEIPTATEIGTYYIWCKADEKALYGQTIYKAYQTPSDKPLIANIKQAIPSVGISSLPTPMAINQNFDINVTAGESSDLVLYEWVKNNITLTPDLKGKFEWDTAPLYFTENTTCQIIFTADNDNDYSKYNWSANNDFIQIVENGKNAVRLAHDINIKVTPRAGWGTPIIREPDKALQWVEPSGRTSIEIFGKYVNKYDILWLLEESDGTKAWYGLDLSNNAFDLNKNLRFYVHWIGPNDKYYKTYYDKLDDSTKKSVENNNGWIFLIGVMDKNGNKIEPNKESLPVKVYVQIVDDWNLDNLKGYFIQEGTDEPVKVTHQRMLYPESKGIDDKYMDDFGVMDMYHFSPYFIYDELTNMVQTGDIVNPTLIYTILVVALIAISLFIWLNFKKYKESKNK